MKRILTVLAAALLTAGLFAQAPQKMSYQAVIRDADNNLIMNQTIGMQISILQGSDAGNVVYSETLTPTTNDNGLVTIEIGGGADFAEIDWADGPYFIKTEADPDGGSSYTIEGTSQLLTVPYALHAKSAETVLEAVIIESGTDIVITGEGTSDDPYVISLAEGTDIGEMSYWDGNDWVAIPPGENGLSLTMCNGIPVWGPCPGKATVNLTSVSNITQSSVRVDAVVVSDGEFEVTERGVVYHREPNPTTANNVVTGGSGTGSYTANITGLSPGQMYYVRAYAINSQGTAYSDQIGFSTVSTEFHGSVTDADGNEYLSVLIGDQEWMASSLRTTKYSDGTDITHVPENSDWGNFGSGAYVYYENNPDWEEHYGALYNWYAVADLAGLCPTGWRVPTDQDWTELQNYIIDNHDFGGVSWGRGIKSCRQIDSPLGGECATTQHPRWASHSTHYGTDNFGFGILPTGSRAGDGQSFSGMGFWSHMWTSTQSSTTHAWARTVYRETSGVGRGEHHKDHGFAVRCIRE